MMVSPWQTTTPAFRVGDIPVHGRAILSPMAGFSDIPYRAICRAYGSAMHYTEFVPVESLIGRQKKFWQRLDFQEGEAPMVFQIFGNDAHIILEAALRIQELGPDIIDINMGCSTRKVSGRGAGVGMMKNPQLVANTFRLLSTQLSVPVTGKIRLGWEENRNYIEIGRIMADNGAALVAIHGRTKQQKYSGTADWDAIATLKQTVDIPVIGNGDIFEPADIDRMLAETGCDGVMIGRGAIGNPWIFAGIRRQDLTIAERFRGITRHLDEMIAYYGEKHGLVLFRKHVKRYVNDLDIENEQLRPLLQTNSAAEFHIHLKTIQATIQSDLSLSQPHRWRQTESLERSVVTPAYAGAGGKQ